MTDTTVKKVSSTHSPVGEQGQIYLASGKRVSMRNSRGMSGLPRTSPRTSMSMRWSATSSRDGPSWRSRGRRCDWSRATRGSFQPEPSTPTASWRPSRRLRPRLRRLRCMAASNPDTIIGKLENLMAALPGRNNSCWVATAPKASFPSLTSSQDCDVVIVGAGIVGLTTALSLCEAGKSVVVLESRRVGAQVTGRSTAKITTQHSLVYRHLIDTVGQDTAMLYAEANRVAVERIPPGSRRSALSATMSARRPTPTPAIHNGRTRSGRKPRRPGS